MRIFKNSKLPFWLQTSESNVIKSAFEAKIASRKDVIICKIFHRHKKRMLDSGGKQAWFCRDCTRYWIGYSVWGFIVHFITNTTNW